MTPDASKKAPTKTEILNSLAEKTQLSKAQISAVFDALSEEIGASLDGPGSFTIPGLVKIERKHVPAKPARTGVPNPFKPGELMDVPAKPASTQTTYYVQAGAYRSANDADAVKAQILMLGLPVQVQKAQVNGATINRVRVGPFKGIDEMNQSRARLSEAKIDSSVVRP